MIMPMLLALLLGLSALLIVIYPLLGLDRAARSVSAPEPVRAEATDAAERERLAKQALRDVDFDYRLGNLEESDYAALRERYERRALAAMKTRYEREQQLDARIDQQLAALRGQQPKSTRRPPATDPRQAISPSPPTPARSNGAAAATSGNASSTVPSPRQQGGPRPRRRKGL